MRGYICTNKVFYNAEAKRYLPMCAMHLKSCIKSHGDGLSVPIDIPNIHGLCNSHHIANFGSVPVPVPFPYPGVERKLKNKGWLVKPSHWGAPTWPPLKPRMCTKKYRPLAKPQTYIEKMQVLAREIRYKKRKKEFGRLAAIAIQAMFRGYRVRHSHKMILLKQKIPYRAERVVQIQCQMRRYLSLQSVKRRRILFHASALNIQKVYKGFLVRRWFKRNQAARVLQRAAKMWKDRHFFSTVMMMIQLKRLFQRRIDASIQIQRIIRGYLSRLHFSRYRQQILMKFSTSAMILQMLFKKHQRYLAEQRRLAKLRDKTKFMKKLAYLVEELYFQRKERHRLKLLVFNAVPVIQALIRGYLGRSRGQRMKFLRKALKTWCQPHYAVEFMREILENKIPKSLYVSENLFQLTTAHMTRSHRKEILLIDFLPHDNQHRSSVDKRVYLFTLTKYYEYLRKPLLISEVQSLYHRFRDPLDGKIRIIELSKYIRTHKQPCHKHGRTICGDCVYHRECTLSNCLCRCFIKDDLTGKVCKECHHAIALHTLLPLDLKPNRKKANQTLVKILEFVSEPDISLPTTIKGLELTDIGKQCYREKKRIQKLQITNSTTLPLSSSFSSSSSTTSTSMEEKNKKEKEFIHSISDLELSAEEICEKTEYWNEKNANLPLNRRKMNEKISITVSSYEPKTKLSTVEFWSNASKNPNKTVRDYHEKFDHNMPFPIVSKDDEIVYTLEGSRIYVELLKKLIILYEKNHKTGIDVDHGDFLKLILNHIQIFERHWRKMVIDIRTGQLNKHLILNDQYIRELYLSTAIPRPSMALQLDHAFRLLGFHKKVLGKDIIIQQYAEKKIIKEKNKRKTSLPMSSSVDNLGSLSHDTTTTTTTTATATASASTTGRLSPLRPILKHAMTARLPINTSDDMKEKSLTLGLSTAGTATAKSPILKPITLSSSSSSPSPKKEKFNKSEALVLASTMGKLAVKEIKEKEKEKETRGATANRHNFVRRGSDTDVVRPITQDEIHRIAHDVQIEPRGKYYHLISVDGRFICPFPACGATFTSREAAFQHLTTHEQKRKLQIPTPLSDSHLNYYWPKDNLWRDSKEYQKRTLPPGSIVCTVPGCKDVFASYHRLEYHLKRIHHIETKSQLLRSFYKFLGRHSRMTPPYPPPENLPTIFCSNHLKLNESCSNCLKILNSDIPKQPLYYYDRIKVDFRKRDGLGEEIIFDRQNTCQKGIIFLDSQGNQHRGRIKGILKDSSEDGWIACEELITIDYAQSLHQQVPYDSDHHHELVPLWVRDGSLDALAGQIAPPIWIRLLDVVTIFPLLEITKEEFIEKLRNREFKVHTYFIRPSSS